jgi:hypothetical protein
LQRPFEVATRFATPPEAFLDSAEGDEDVYVRVGARQRTLEQAARIGQATLPL